VLSIGPWRVRVPELTGLINRGKRTGNEIKDQYIPCQAPMQAQQAMSWASPLWPRTVSTSTSHNRPLARAVRCRSLTLKPHERSRGSRLSVLHASRGRKLKWYSQPFTAIDASNLGFGQSQAQFVHEPQAFDGRFLGQGCLSPTHQTQK
jgi:hypothetical protein